MIVTLIMLLSMTALITIMIAFNKCSLLCVGPVTNSRHVLSFIHTADFDVISAAAAKSLQSCPTLCNPIELASPGSSVHGISRARTLEWVAISFSRRSSQPRDRTLIFCVSCIGRWILYHYHHLGSLRHSINCLYLVLLICPFSFFLPIGYFWVSPVLFFDSAAFLFRFQNNKSYSIILFLHLSFPPPIPCL